MPKTKWTGYRRFCPFARALDLVGERWTLVIVHELLGDGRRYTDLQRRLPGISTAALADRLRKLEHAGVVRRQTGGVGEPVTYGLTESGRALAPAMRALRQWGSKHLACPPDGEASFDITYVEGIDALGPEEYEWHVDDRVVSLRFADGELVQRDGPAEDPALVLTTSADFMRRWAAGDVDWDGGREAGDVVVDGDDESWSRMLAATGYLRRYDAPTT